MRSGLFVLIFIFSTASYSHEESVTTQNGGSPATGELTYAYRDCQRVSEFGAQPEPDKAIKLKLDPKSTGEKKIFSATSESNPKSIAFESTSVEQRDGLTVWRGKATVDWYGSRETQVEVIETNEEPKRTIYMVANPFPSDVWKSYGDAAGADPRPMDAREAVLFDNLGNYVEIRSEAERKDKTKRYFKLAEACAGKDLFGFPNIAEHLGWNAPVVPKAFPWDKVPRNKMKQFAGTKDEFERDDPILPLGEEAVQKQVANQLLEDADNLSPALKAAAEGMKNGSHRSVPLWKLRSFLLERIKL